MLLFLDRTGQSNAEVWTIAGFLSHFFIKKNLARRLLKIATP
jgi:hypothetical protein